MSSVSGANNNTSTGSSSSSATKGNDLRNVDLNQFLTLLVTEMQNQDPMNPMDNAQMLTQISQIREIGSTNQLTETLTSFATGQQMTMASSLIGKTVSALDDKAKEVKGVVNRVTIETDDKDPTKRRVKVHIGDSTVDMNNIRGIDQQAS